VEHDSPKQRSSASRRELRESIMVSQMNLVQNAAQLAMADHRAAGPRPARRKDRPGWTAALAVLFAVLAGWWLTAAD
jgi:hypothetical protein